MTEQCPFCDLAILDSEFASSSNFRAVYNLAPILPGHSLIIPKKHVKSFMDLSEDHLHELVSFSRHTMRALLATFNVSGFNWTIQEGGEAGQTIPHLHVHLIPRQVNDLRQPGDWYPLLRQSESEIIDSEERTKLSRQDMRQIVQEIKKHVKPFVWNCPAEQ